jgi:NADPH:quinone reductase-like Zn-dependent oxidoreductase
VSDFDHSGSGAVVTGGASEVGVALLQLLAELGGTDVTVSDLGTPGGPDQAFPAMD